MAAPTPDDLTMRCSFCTKSEAEIDKLIAGPGVYICNTCVRLCVDILAHTPELFPGFKLPGSTGMTDEEMLEILPRLARMNAQVDTGLSDWVGQLRDRDVTWARIGEALGMTRQSAWEKFATEER